MREPGFETLCAHAGEDPHRFSGAVIPPIFQNSLFVAPDVESFLMRGHRHPDAYDYTRVANPTTDILEAKLAALERTEAARCFASGMAAAVAAILHGVRVGDHVVAVETAYGPTRNFLSGYLERFHIAVTFVEGSDPQQFADALRPNTRVFYLESPSSMVFHLQDFAAVTGMARERGILTIADNSWASPYFQNPAALGVDLVVHSATKYLGGHSDIVAGVVAGPKERLRAIKDQEGSLLGSILDPFAAWLMLRGLRTLPIRMERHQSSALTIARYLEAHPRIARVHHPGLPSHPQHALARRQLRGTSGLFSVEFAERDQRRAFAMINRLRYFGLGVSWGGFESLIVPMLFPSGNWGARLHIGLETVEDLQEDLENALKG